MSGPAASGSQALRRALYRFRQSWLSVAGLVIVIALILTALVGPALVPYPEHVAGAIRTAARFQAPSAHAWFGTNEVGQDVFSLTVAGSRVSLLAGLGVVLLGAAWATAS